MRSQNLIRTSIYYSLIFMATAGFMMYISLFFDSLGLSEGKIGILVSMGAVVAFFANPFWGIRSDRAETKNRVLQLCQLMAVITVWLFPLVGNHFLLLFIVTCIFFFFQSVIDPLSDAVALEIAAREGFRFSTVRTAGSLGFAVMSLIAGTLVYYHINMIFAVYSILIFIAIFVFHPLPAVKGYQRNTEKVQFWKVLQNPQLRKIYFYVLVLSASFGFFGTFHALYSVEQGISTKLLGIGIMIGSFSQFPFMLYFDRLYKRFGIRKIILVSGLFSVVRWALYAVWLTPFTLMLLWMLHGGTYIVIYLCITEYVHRHVQKELKASGQMMNFIVLSAVGRIFGGVLGGIAAQSFGFSLVFSVIAGLCLIAVITLWFFTRPSHHAPLEVENQQSTRSSV